MQGDVIVEVSGSTTLFKSKTADVQIPLPIDTVNAIKREAVMGIIKASKTKMAQIEPALTCSASDVTSFVDNAQAITQVGAEVIIKSSGASYVMLSVTTPKGKVEEKFKGKAERPFALDFAFLKAALARSKDTVEVKLDEAFAIVSSKEVTYIAALSEMAS